MNIENFLTTHGPCLSSKVKAVMLKDGISEVAARQSISRAKGEVCHLREIKFPKNASFLYLKRQYNTYEYFSSLYQAFTYTSSVHAYIINALSLFDGCISEKKLKGASR